MTAQRDPGGYTDEELDAAERRFGLRFLPDLRELLKTQRAVLPGGYRWVDDDARVQAALDGVFEGLAFDVEQNGLWRAEWGARPDAEAHRRAVLRAVLDAAPKLVPLEGHRFLPCEPFAAGNPVFSIVQSDVIVYGLDLDDYRRRERDGYDSLPFDRAPREVPFWSSWLVG